jgi:hypothetical protein
MSFLISIIKGHDVYLAAPKNPAGYSHILKEKKYLFGCINDDKTLFHKTKIEKPTITDLSNWRNVKDFQLTLEGKYEAIIASKDIIYHLSHDGNLYVSTDFKVIGENSDMMYGAIYASRTWSNPVDRIKIACECAGYHDCEIVSSSVSPLPRL